MPPISRTLIAFAVAPLIAPIVLSLYFGLNGPASLMLFILLFGAAFAYGATLLAGVPLYLLLRRWGRDSLDTIVPCGALLGLGCWMFFLFAFPLFTGGSPKNFYEVFVNLGVFDFLILPLLLGAASGLVFWLIARPDRNRVAMAA